MNELEAVFENGVFRPLAPARTGLACLDLLDRFG